MDIRALSVETYLAGRLYPGGQKDLIAYMEKVNKILNDDYFDKNSLRLATDTSTGRTKKPTKIECR